jgi:hypothetical protein
MKLNKNERRQTSFPQVWKQLPYFLVKSDASKHLRRLANAYTMIISWQLPKQYRTAEASVSVIQPLRQ